MPQCARFNNEVSLAVPVKDTFLRMVKEGNMQNDALSLVSKQRRGNVQRLLMEDDTAPVNFGMITTTTF